MNEASKVADFGDILAALGPAPPIHAALSTRVYAAMRLVALNVRLWS
jgi:hypothetical protein